MVTMKQKLNLNQTLEEEIAKRGVMTAQELVELLVNKMQLKRKSEEGVLLSLLQS